MKDDKITFVDYKDIEMLKIKDADVKRARDKIIATIKGYNTVLARNFSKIHEKEKAIKDTMEEYDRYIPDRFAANINILLDAIKDFTLYSIKQDEDIKDAVTELISKFGKTEEEE